MKISKAIIDTNLTWLCCDAGLFLQHLSSTDPKQRLLRVEIFNVFRFWAKKMWKFPGSLEVNESVQPGFFEHSLLVKPQIVASAFSATALHDAFFRFMRDMNLSFLRLKDDDALHCNCTAQSLAFLRLARSIANVLERMGEIVGDIRDEVKGITVSIPTVRVRAAPH